MNCLNWRECWSVLFYAQEFPILSVCLNSTSRHIRVSLIPIWIMYSIAPQQQITLQRVLLWILNFIGVQFILILVCVLAIYIKAFSFASMLCTPVNGLLWILYVNWPESYISAATSYFTKMNFSTARWICDENISRFLVYCEHLATCHH